MNPDLDTLVTGLYVTVDDLLLAHPHWAPERPAVGIAPELSDAELVAPAALQALSGFDSEARFVRYAQEHLTPWFPLELTIWARRWPTVASLATLQVLRSPVSGARRACETD